MPVFRLSYTFVDTEGDDAQVGAYVNVADEAAALTAWGDLAVDIGVMSGALLSAGNVSRPISEATLSAARTAIALVGGARPMAGAANDVSHGMRFFFQHSEGDTEITIPGFRELLMTVNGKTADLANISVDNFVDYMVGGTVVDRRGAAISLLEETRETWAGKPA